MAAAARTLAATLAYCCRAAAPSSARRLVRTQATLPTTRDIDGVAALLQDGAKCVVMLGAGASVGGTLFAIGGSKFSRDAKTFCFDNRVFALTTRLVEEKKEPWWVMLQPSKWKLPKLECLQKRK